MQLRRTTSMAVTFVSALALTLTACDSGGSGQATPTTTPATRPTRSTTEQTGGGGSANSGQILFASALKRLGSCSNVLDHLKKTALEHVGPYGFDEGGSPYFGEFGDRRFANVAEDSFAAAPTAGATTQSTAAASGASNGAPLSSDTFSKTNVQEAGVDEPDIVKNDGQRILAIAQNTFHVIDVTGTKPRIADSINFTSAIAAKSPINGPGVSTTFSQILVQGDRAIVFGQSYGFGGLRPAIVEDAGISRLSIESYSPPTAMIAELDLSTIDDIKLVSTLRIEGAYLSARQVGSVVRMVVSSPATQLAFVTPQSEAGKDRATATNRDVINESTLADWLPAFVLTRAGQDDEVGTLGSDDCDHIDAPTHFAGFGMVSVLTFDLTKPLDSGSPTAILAQADNVYASTDHLYVATTSYVPPSVQSDEKRTKVIEEQYATSIHRFAIPAEGPAVYEASGTVTGHLLNQFSMSELDGQLRVVSTKGSPWGFRENTSETMVTVLERNDDELTKIGQVGGMGKGERVQSVRFLGDRAYVVTFRQTDPFYVVDLSNPTKPRVAGELKLPGFSSYLHPISDGYVLGVGSEATESGLTTGAKATLFDVRDSSNPKAVGSWTLDNAYAGASWDHHAFLYWAAEHIAVLPIQGGYYGPNGAGASAVVLRVDPQSGVTEVGRIERATVESNCRRIDLSELTNGFGGAIVQACGPNEGGSQSGYDCSPIPTDQLPSYYGFEQSMIDKLELAADETFEICQPGSYTPIDRIFVIGDNLWAMSQFGVQANDIKTFDPVTAIGF